MPLSETHLIDWRKYAKDLPDKFFDILIADPNYGINAPNMKIGAGAPCRGGKTSTAVRLKGRLNTGSGKLKDRILNRSEID